MLQTVQINFHKINLSGEKSRNVIAPQSQAAGAWDQPSAHHLRSLLYSYYDDFSIVLSDQLKFKCASSVPQLNLKAPRKDKEQYLVQKH